MPTYYAIAVTATLATCDLHATLSTNMSSFKQGAEHKRDVSRVQKAFSTADKFSERPITEDGIMQFVGVDGDMPFYIVEAEKKATDKTKPGDDVEMQDALDESAAAPLNELPVFSDDSPLTSLGATPTPTRQSLNDSPLKEPPPVQPTMEDIASLAKDHTLQNKVQTARSLLNSSNAQALVLDIQLCNRSFLPEEKMARGVKQLAGKDLKIEVFINGQLADVSIVHGNEKRRHAVQVDGDKVRFAGTRVHRQVEKPWIYSREASNPDELPEAGDAERRWNIVSSAHLTEAEMRGRDGLGDPPPSAEFLLALAGLRFPQRGRERQGLGIVDIVITAGKGKKYGPETLYLMGPTRMDDSNYGPQEPSYPYGAVQPTTPLQQPNVLEITAASPDITLGQHSLPATLNAVSPTPKKIVDLTKELNLDVDPRKTIIGSFENSRGMMGKSGRTLRQRLGDLKKMNSANLEEELAKLKDEFGAKEPAQKKLKLGDGLAAGFDVFGPNTIADSEMTIDPTKLLRETPKLQDGADPEAVLTQNRIDMALNEGAASNGALLRRITSTSPQRTPKRKTKASALAGSPTSVPVKTPPRKGAAAVTPNRNKLDVDGSPISNRKAADSAKRDASPFRSVNGTNGTPQKVKSAEQSVSETLKAFKIPDCCQGSCVSYDEDESVSRQIGKARGGEFKEETFLVGMRFVVV